MTVELRPMRWWDVEAALPVERTLFGADAWSAETFWAELARPATRSYWTATCGTRLVGYGGVTVVGPDADVQTLAVAPEAQGSGVGRQLLQRLVTTAAGRGAAQLLLEVRADNERAIGVYERAGFERIARRRGYYERDGVDAIIMRLRPLATRELSGD